VITIAALFTYPVKSCRGTAHDSVLLEEAGLAHDREWMFVTPGGRFLTQREEPRLARVFASLQRDELRLSAEGAGEVCVPLDFAGPRGEVTVWRDRVSAFDQGDEPAAWISSLLGRDARLVRFDPAARRRCDPAWTAGAEAHSRFSDGYPLMVISRASLDDLNSRLSAPLPMDRFRPNLVLDGLPPYGEDEVRELIAQGIRLRVVKPCTRCSITTTDQAVGVVAGDEPLRTLKSYRWDAALHGVTFGRNTIVIEGTGSTLEAGMSLTATHRERHQDQR
jgi:uncharacterized protein